MPYFPPAASGGGQILYDKVLATSGGDYTDLATALAAMSAGETLFVRSGTYTLTGNITTALNEITIIGENPQSTTINTSTFRLLFNGNSITLQNLEFTIANTSSIAVQMGNASNIVTNCVFRSTTRFTMLYARGTITNNLFINTSTTSNSNNLVELTNQDTIFSNNYLEAPMVGSGAILAASSAEVNSNYIRGQNNVLGNTCNCITMSGGTVTANFCYLDGSDYGGVGIYFQGDNNTITGNRVQGPFWHGIFVPNGNNVRYSVINGNNIFMTNVSSVGGHGIKLSTSSNESTDNIISNNHIWNNLNNNGAKGIYLDTGGVGLPYNNVITNNRVRSYGNGIEATKGNNNVISNNTIRSTSQKAIDISGTATRFIVSNNNIRGTNYTDYNNVINTATNTHSISGNIIDDTNALPFDGNVRDTVITKFYRNQTGSTINANSVVIIDSTSTGTDFKTTTTAGDPKVVGVLKINTSTGNWGQVVVEGKVTVNADATVAISIGDWLTTHTTAGSVKKAGEGDTIIGRAMTALASGTGTVDMNVMSPFTLKVTPGQTPYDAIVAPSGGDFTTLSSAMNTLTGDAKILIMPGTYTETGVTSPTTSAVVIDSYGYSATILNFGANSFTTASSSTVNNVKFQFSTGALTIPNGCVYDNVYVEVTGNSLVNGKDVDVTGNDVEIRHMNIVANSHDDGLYGLGLTGNNIKVTNSYVSSSSNSAVVEVAGNNCVVENTDIVVSGAGVAGMEIAGANAIDAKITNCTFNLAATAPADGILIASTATKPTISNNTFNDGMDSIKISTNTTGAVIADNIIDTGEIGSIGVNIDSSDYCVVTGNNIVTADAGSTGILIATASNNNTVNSNFVNSAGDGINIDNANCNDNMVCTNHLSLSATPFTDTGTGTFDATGSNKV